MRKTFDREAMTYEMSEEDRRKIVWEKLKKLGEDIVRRAKEEDERRISLADSKEAENKIENMIDKRGWSVSRYSAWKDKIYKGAQ